MEQLETLVVGGGAAGLGVAAELIRRDLPVTILEARCVGASWRGRYDGLRLNTMRSFSSLPRKEIPRASGRWPSRDDFVDYLAAYARRIPMRTGVEVGRIDRTPSGYLVSTNNGDIDARNVVVALGIDRQPKLPAWPGIEDYHGSVIHSVAYRNPIPFIGRHVLVIGAGNSGSEIATQLAYSGAQRVDVSLRTPPNILRREIFGVPATILAWMSTLAPDGLTDRVGFLLQRALWGDLRPYGIDRSPHGIATTIKIRGGPTIDDGFVDAIRTDQITICPAVERFDSDEVILADGTRLRPDAVIAATGYTPALEPIVGHLGILQPAGFPAVTGGTTAPHLPGLYFNGYRVNLVGPLPLIKRSSRQIARSIARHAGAHDHTRRRT